MSDLTVAAGDDEALRGRFQQGARFKVRRNTTEQVIVVARGGLHRPCHMFCLPVAGGTRKASDGCTADLSRANRTRRIRATDLSVWSWDGYGLVVTPLRGRRHL